MSLVKKEKEENKKKTKRRTRKTTVRERETGVRSSTFSLRSMEIGPSIFVGARGKVYLRDESFA